MNNEDVNNAIRRFVKTQEMVSLNIARLRMLFNFKNTKTRKLELFKKKDWQRIVVIIYISDNKKNYYKSLSIFINKNKEKNPYINY